MPAKKTKPAKENTLYKRMVSAAKDLQAALRFEPPLDHTLPEEELKGKLAEAADEIQEGDILKDETWDLLEELEFIDRGDLEPQDDELDGEEVLKPEKPKKVEKPDKSEPKKAKSKTSKADKVSSKYTRLSAFAEVIQSVKTKTISFTDLSDKSDQLFSDRTGKSLNSKMADFIARRALKILQLFELVELENGGNVIRPMFKK